MSHDAATTPSSPLLPPPPPPTTTALPHKYFDESESNGPRPRVPGQEARVHQMTEGPPKGAGGLCGVSGGGGGGASGSDAAGSIVASAATAACLGGPSVATTSSASSSSVTVGPTKVAGPSSSATSAGGYAAMSSSATAISIAAAANKDWHQCLITLLDDSSGAELFKRYVEQHGGIHADRLNFYFACEGLKQQTEPAQIRQMVAAIYKFLRKSKITLGNELRARIKAELAASAAGPIDAHIFDAMQLDAVHTISETTFPDFLKSDLYVRYLNAASSAPSAPPPRQQQQQHQQQQHQHQSQQHQHQPSTHQHHQQLHHQHQQQQAPPLQWMASAPPAAMHLKASPYSTTGSSSRTLMTLHENSELASCGMLPALSSSLSSSLVSSMPLTENSLRATEGPRLGVRPSGAHGYVGKFSSAYNPVSLQNSECMSVSSGGGLKNDPDNRHMNRSTREGRPEHHRRSEHGSSGGGGGSMRPGVASDKHINQHNTNLTVQDKEMPMQSSMRATNVNKLSKLSPEELFNIVAPQLEEIKRQQEFGIDTNAKLSHGQSFVNADRYSEAVTFAADDDDNQSILDKHVSRVWDKSPQRSPGTKSPYPSDMCAGLRSRHMDGAMLGGSGGAEPFSLGSSGGGGGSMRHPRSMPDRRQASASAIGGGGGKSSSMASSSVHTGGMFTTSRTRSMGTEVACSSTLEEARRRLEDEYRMSRHIAHGLREAAPLPPPPPPPAAAQVNGKTHESTMALIRIDDEAYPYLYVLAGLQPTLKQVKEILPKKGDFRFFFKFACDDPDSPVIQLEVSKDTDILPLFEGKVVGVARERV